LLFHNIICFFCFRFNRSQVAVVMPWGVTLPWNLRGEELRPANTFELYPCSDCADTITTSAIGIAGPEARLWGGLSFALCFARDRQKK
jgi:hypothetical protein